MQTATKHPQMDKLEQPLKADHDQNIVKADLNNNSQNIAIDLNNNSDTFLTSAVKRFEAKVPHAKLVGFENSGHFVPMEQPQETRTAIVDFLKEHKIIG